MGNQTDLDVSLQCGCASCIDQIVDCIFDKVFTADGTCRLSREEKELVRSGTAELRAQVKLELEEQAREYAFWRAMACYIKRFPESANVSLEDV